MKKILFLALTIPALYLGQDQKVGLNTENPQALLDVVHFGIPNSSTGILIPTLNNFSSTNPTAEQNGLLVYYKGTEMNHGFYYWDANEEAWQYIFQRNSLNNNLATVAYVATTPFTTISKDDTSWNKTIFDKINTPNTKFKISSAGDIIIGESGSYNLYFTGGLLQEAPNPAALSYEITIIKKAGGIGPDITLQTALLTTPAADVSDRSSNTTISLNHLFNENDTIIVKTRRLTATSTDTKPSTTYSLLLSKLSV